MDLLCQREPGPWHGSIVSVNTICGQSAVDSQLITTTPHCSAGSCRQHSTTFPQLSIASDLIASMYDSFAGELWLPSPVYLFFTLLRSRARAQQHGLRAAAKPQAYFQCCLRLSHIHRGPVFYQAFRLLCLNRVQWCLKYNRWRDHTDAHTHARTKEEAAGCKCYRHC